MVNGNRWMLLLLALFLVTPTVAAAGPSASYSSAVGLGDQEVSDLAVDDATGRFALAAPVYTSPKVVLPGQAAKSDVYICDFQSAGCHGYATPVSGSNGARQVADAVSFPQTNGLTARFAVGGPGSTVALWSNLRSSPEWTNDLREGTIVAVAVEPVKADYVVSARTDAIGTSGFVRVHFPNNGTMIWDWAATSEAGAASGTRPTSMDHARTGGLLVVGTSKGVFFLNPAGAKPATYLSTSPMDIGNVGEVLVTRTGTAVLARTGTGIDYIPVEDGKPVRPQWTRPLSPAPSAIAMSEDGGVFAAASGSKIHFFRHLNDSFIATEVGTAYDVGVTVTDLDYDSSGSLLVAIAGNRVLGFGPTENTPIWNFDATLPVNGGLDGPLRKVSVSDSADRVVVAGKTRMMPYVTKVAAQVDVVGPMTRSVTPGQSAVIDFDLVNTGSLSDDFTLVVTRPIGWKGEQSAANFTVAPDQSKRFNLTVDSPPGERPGQQAVTVEVRSAKLQTVVAKTTVNLSVPRAVALDIIPPGDTGVFQPGVEQEVVLLLRNVGNADGLVNLSAKQSLARGGPAWQIRFVPEQVSISAAGEVTTRMSITPPADATSGERNTITILAKEGVSESKKVFTAFINPEFAVDVNTGSVRLELEPGESRTFTVNVTNRGNTDDRFNITANVTPTSQVNEWNVRVSKEQVEIGKGLTERVTITIRPAVAEPRDGASLVIKAVSTGSNDEVEDSVNVALVPIPAREDDKRSFLPAPSPALIAGIVVLAALSRRAVMEARR